MDTEQALLRIREALSPEVMARYRVRDIGLFGSYARGEQTDTSDVDVLVDFADEANLLDLVGLADFLEEHLQCKVDVVSRRALRPEMRDAVLSDVIRL